MMLEHLPQNVSIGNDLLNIRLETFYMKNKPSI